MAYSYGGSSVQGQTLDLHVVGCYNLADKEWFSRQDPYVVIEYGGQKFRTRTDTDGGKNPSFNETFKIALIEGLREVNANVWNSNIGRDDYIGSAKILLNNVIATGYDDTQWSLTNSRSGKSSGNLKLIMRYAGSVKNKPGKFDGSSPSQAGPAATPSMHYGPPAPAYGPAAPAYGPAAPAYGPAASAYYPPPQSVMPYPPPAGYGPPPVAAQAYIPTYPAPAYPAQPSYYPQASAPGNRPAYPPPGYPPAGGYPQHKTY